MFKRSQPVMTTRCIGMQPHYSGHPLAPMEYVYVCEEPKPTPRLSVAWIRWLAIGVCIGFLALLQSL